MKKIFTSELLPALKLLFCCTGIKRNTYTRWIIIILFSFTSLLCAQSINNESTQTFIDDWQFLGLENESVTAIAVDWSNPNIIFAGSGSDYSSGTVGGMFKTTDAGVSWDTLIRGVTVRDLDIHPTTPNTIYATLGLNFLTQPGIIKSIDGGDSWINADSGITITPEEGPTVLEIDPQWPDILYTGTSGPFGGKPYKSTNGGESWFRVDPDSLWVWMPTCNDDSIFVNGYPLRDGITAIAIDTENTNIIYAGTAYNGDLFKSANGGNSWAHACLRAGIINSIQFGLVTSTIYVGTSWSEGFTVGIFKTTDTGQNWNNATFGLPDSLNVEKIQACRDCNNEIFFIVGNWGENGGIYQSVNNGQWNKIGINENPIHTIKLFNEKLYAGQNGIYVKQILTNVNENIQMPFSLRLYSSYPNPFNSITIIEYEINKEGNTAIEIFDVLGKKVKTLVYNSQKAGKYSTFWNGNDEQGNPVSSGVYLYNLRVQGFRITKKLIYLR